MLVYFRKRINKEIIDKINRQIVTQTLEEQEKKTQKQKKQNLKRKIKGS